MSGNAGGGAQQPGADSKDAFNQLLQKMIGSRTGQPGATPTIPQAGPGNQFSQTYNPAAQFSPQGGSHTSLGNLAGKGGGIPPGGA